MIKSKTYTPKPIDTSDVELPKELRDLTEYLSENTHENWAAQRIKDGWTYGPKDSKYKTNPDLVPYSQLSDSDKEYDRLTSIETIKVILKKGFKIEITTQ